MQDTKEATVQLPVDRLSYSSVAQLLKNPLIWKLKYVLGVYDGKMSVSGMIGRAGHEALKVYYGGNKDIPTPADRSEAMALAMDTGMQYLIDYSDVYINYGKTGTREEMLKGYTQAMQFYFAEEPTYNEIVMCEEKMTAELKTVDGDILPLPAVGVPDIVDRRKDGGVDIVDVKFVKTFTNYESEDYVKIFQAQMLWHLLRATKNITADKCIFREVKRTANKDGTAQVRDYVVPLNHEPYRIIFYNLYKDIVKFISTPNQVYLPNLSPTDPDHAQAGELYAQGLLTADMSDVEVMHKVKDVAMVSKLFVPSRLDNDINKNLNPEDKIKLRLAEFGIPVVPLEPMTGASVIQYRFKVSAGIPMSRFAKHKADIARAIEAKTEIRILAPIPGTDLVGIEVATGERSAAKLTKAELVPNTLSIPVGVTVSGEVVKVLLNDMPHLLIAGATGSGKSVLLHSIITALTKQMTAEEMRMMMIDPKRVELAAFKGLKHLKGSKIAYEYADAMLILRGLSAEMERRYKLLEKAKVRDITGYNKKQKQLELLPYIVLVVDEFADLIHQSKQAERKAKKASSLKNIATRVQVEAMARQFAKMGMPFNPKIEEKDDSSADELLARLAAMARAVGIHLIIATQRPSIDVITGLIKANFPTRIALTTASATDSKVILGVEGAEKLSGKGDMLFMHPGGGQVRLQGFLTE